MNGREIKKKKINMIKATIKKTFYTPMSIASVKAILPKQVVYIIHEVQFNSLTKNFTDSMKKQNPLNLQQCVLACGITEKNIQIWSHVIANINSSIKWHNILSLIHNCFFICKQST